LFVLKAPVGVIVINVLVLLTVLIAISPLSLAQEDVSSEEVINMPRYEPAPDTSPANDIDSEAGRGSSSSSQPQESGLQNTGTAQSQTAQTQNTGAVLPPTSQVQRPSTSQVLLSQPNTGTLGVVSSPSQATPDVSVPPSQTLSVNTKDPFSKNNNKAKQYTVLGLLALVAGLFAVKLIKKRPPA
jgi:hypothetical protein